MDAPCKPQLLSRSELTALRAFLAGRGVDGAEWNTLAALARQRGSVAQALLEHIDALTAQLVPIKEGLRQIELFHQWVIGLHPELARCSGEGYPGSGGGGVPNELDPAPQQLDHYDGPEAAPATDVNSGIAPVDLHHSAVRHG